MLLDHVFTRDVTANTSTRTERKVAMSGRVIVEIWQLPAPGLSEEALGADVVYGHLTLFDCRCYNSDTSGGVRTPLLSRLMCRYV